VGTGEFINEVTAGRKFGMDLNPDATTFAGRGVEIIRQDCFRGLAHTASSLDVYSRATFSSTCLRETALERTLNQVHKLSHSGRRNYRDGAEYQISGRGILGLFGSLPCLSLTFPVD